MTNLSEPFRVAGHTCQIGASVGLNTCINPNQRDLDQIIIDADRALYEAKTAGRGQFRTFDHSLRSRYDRISALGSEIIDAIEADQFTPFFQPKVKIDSGHIWGVEALARWQHPKLGNVPPIRFIPVAEVSGLIKHLTRWATRTSCWETTGGGEIAF